MSEGVEFEEEKKQYSKPSAPPGGASFAKHSQEIINQYSPIENEPKMIRWLIKHGYTSTPAFGRVVLLVIVLINAAITYFVIQHFL